MNADPVWPAQPAEIVLWAELLSIWIVASYVIAPALPPRSEARRGGAHAAAIVAIGTVGLVGWLLPPQGTSTFVRVALSSLVAVAMTANVVGRRMLTRGRLKRHLAEWEIGTNAVVALAAAAVIGLGEVGSAPGESVVRSGKLAAGGCVVAALAFVFRGGTYIVRSVLDKVDAAPRVSVSPGADEVQRRLDLPELNRGRAIGNLERLLMVMVIGLGSYEALGFLVAAKGLIRAREFEDRDFAEYFILGSLTSVAVALVVGTLLRVCLKFLWGLP